MPRYRHKLPQLQDQLFLTDAGIETTLIFHEGQDLPYFAAFDLLRTESGRQVLLKYFRSHANIAVEHGLGFILESATWRASADWAKLLGYSAEQLAQANHQAIAMLVGLRDVLESEFSPMVISGCVGPRGDGYDPGTVMSPTEAERYHSEQIASFAASEADLITAITMTNTNEAIGIARAAQAAGIPSVISFTVETDGRLPTGQPLGEAVQAVDAASNGAPAYYMINCAHPTHFDTVLEPGDWMQRVRGIRANASTCSHAELDEAETLDDGNPAELGQQYAELRRRFPHINVLGGCCGTDHRHIQEISLACAA